jgi:hypothetical protein
VSLSNDPRALALAVDERLRALPPGCDPARLFAVRLRADGFVLVPFWSGVAREIPTWVFPPRGADALALETTGWAAPMEPDGSVAARPSRHPERRRIHHTTVLHGAGEDISVLRYEDENEDEPADEPVILEDAIGVVPDLLRACWSRRPAA